MYAIGVKKRLLRFFCLSVALLLMIVLVGCADKAGETQRTHTPIIPTSDHDVSVLFINVGRADATLLTIDGHRFMIDTGEKTSVPALFRALAQSGVEILDAVFLTHTHSDHIGGMEALSKRCTIGKLYSAEISENTKKGENKIENLASELSLNHVKLKAGDVVPLVEDVSFEVLGPLTYNADDDNDNSLVLRLHVNGKTVLFTGDMQFAEESTLLEKYNNLTADVLKVGNHGNPDATSDEFAKAVSPELAVIPTNTAEDVDSANPRVKEALGNATIYVTQDYRCGALLIVQKDGSISVTDPKVESATAKLRITAIDKQTQTVTLLNEGKDADISGYFLFSEKGSEVFVFPKNAAVKAGKTVTVACEGGTGDFIWPDKNVWNDKKEDVGVLYDRYGNELSRFH